MRPSALCSENCRQASRRSSRRTISRRNLPEAWSLPPWTRLRPARAARRRNICSPRCSNSISQGRQDFCGAWARNRRLSPRNAGIHPWLRCPHRRKAFPHRETHRTRQHSSRRTSPAWRPRAGSTLCSAATRNCAASRRSFCAGRKTIPASWGSRVSEKVRSWKSWRGASRRAKPPKHCGAARSSPSI